MHPYAVFYKVDQSRQAFALMAIGLLQTLGRKQ